MTETAPTKAPRKKSVLTIRTNDQNLAARAQVAYEDGSEVNRFQIKMLNRYWKISYVKWPERGDTEGLFVIVMESNGTY